MLRQLKALLNAGIAGAGIVLALAAGTSLGGGGATGTGYIAMGAVDDFGSIFVNGIEFFTDKAAITINGATNRPESDLRIGMVLTVNGTLGGNGKTGNAATVVYQADAIGLVDRAPTFGANSFEFGVLGQSVSTSARTVYSGVISAGQLQVGDFVEVSGFRTDTGLLAARIEKKPSFATVQVKGAIANVTPSTYTTGALTVDYGIASRKNVPSSGLAAGMTVLAKGPVPVNGVLTATEIEVVTQNLSGNTNGSSSGVVSGFTGAAFTVNGLAIQVTSATQYVNGAYRDLADGKTVKVDFAIVGGTTLVATKVEFTKLNAPVDITAVVTANFGSTVELFGPNGVILTFDGNSQLQDKTPAKVRTLGVSDLAVGDTLQLRGNEIDEAKVLVLRLDRINPQATVSVGARARSVAAPQFNLLDTVVVTNAGTTFVDENGVVIPAATFFSRAAGHNVSVTGTAVADTITALTARIE